MSYFAPVPLILPFLLLLSFKQTGLRASLLSTISAIAITVLMIWEPAHIAEIFLDSSRRASGIAFGVLTVLLPGLLLYNFQAFNGSLDKIITLLTYIIRCRELQVVTLVVGVSPFLEAISGFGVSVLLVAPLLTALGFSNLKSGILVLLSQISIPLGALGVGTTIGSQLADVSPNEIGQISLLLSAPLPAIFSVIALAVAFGRDRAGRYAVPAILAGSLKSCADFVLTGAVGVEVAGSLSGLLVIAFLILWERVFSRGRAPFTSSYPDNVLLACVPYIILIFLLLLTRTHSGIKSILSNIWTVEIFGSSFSYSLLYMPGTFIFIATLAAILANRPSWSEFFNIIRQTATQFVTPGLTIFTFILLSQIMIVSGMVVELAKYASVLGTPYIVLVSILGALGGWLTGSNSGGNAMFMPMQIEVANTVGLQKPIVAGAQNAAASYASMGSPARIVLVSATLSDTSIEKDLTRNMLYYVTFSTYLISFAFAVVLACHL